MKILKTIILYLLALGIAILTIPLALLEMLFDKVNEMGNEI